MAKKTVLTRAAETAGRVVGGTARVVAGRVAPPPNDPVEMLERDHRRLEEMLKEGEETTARASKRRREVLERLAAALVAHERMEEKVLYPALKRHSEAREIVLEGYQEHHVADVLVKELRRMPPDDERWGAKFKVLKENIEHHIEEEEGEMFRTARAVFSRDQLSAIGTKMQREQQPAARRGTRKRKAA
jgi:hemerythrin-like domain-containing protein